MPAAIKHTKTTSSRSALLILIVANFSSRSSRYKTERIGKKIYRTRAQAKADVFDYIECFYNPTRRHSTLGYLSPIDFEREAGVA